MGQVVQVFDQESCPGGRCELEAVSNLHHPEIETPFMVELEETNLSLSCLTPPSSLDNVPADPVEQRAQRSARGVVA